MNVETHSDEAVEPYPGSYATSSQLLAMADEYRRAADLLRAGGRRGVPLSWAPFRLTAIQAIELYLSALLRHRGHTHGSIRGLQHDISARAELARSAGLRLRARTSLHLTALSTNREYLFSRYAPERTEQASQINRLAATLEEVAIKVTTVLSPIRSNCRNSNPEPRPRCEIFPES